MATARQINPGDYNDWFEKWSTLAEVTNEKGRGASKAGHTISACKAYLRATEYWRQSIFFIRHDIGDSRLQRGWQAHRAAFRAALPFLPWKTTIAEIPFGNGQMGAYLLRPDHTSTTHPTILAPCGMDSTAEAGYSAIAYMALPRGYNVLLWEGPGQGGMLYEERIPMRPDFEAVLTAVIDWLLTKPGVDANGLVLVGRSFAGYLAPRGRRLFDLLICEKKFVRFTEKEGAGGHCCGLGQTLWEETVFDRIAEVIGKKGTSE